MCKDLVLVFLCFLLVGAMGAPQGGEFEDVDLPPGTGRMLDIKFIPPSKLQSPIFEVVDPHDFAYLNEPGRGGRALFESDHDRQDLRTASAVAIIQAEGEADISGEIIFIQRNPPSGATMIQGNITGLPPGKHGLHIHQSGDLRQGCEKVGEHFNPYLAHHGGPKDGLRHLGDLGNIETPAEGRTEFQIVDPLISLVGAGRNVVGRAIVIKAEEDDFGRGLTADSASTGSTSRALACGVIAYIK